MEVAFLCSSFDPFIGGEKWDLRACFQVVLLFFFKRMQFEAAKIHFRLFAL